MIDRFGREIKEISVTDQGIFVSNNPSTNISLMGNEADYRLNNRNILFGSTGVRTDSNRVKLNQKGIWGD